MGLSARCGATMHRQVILCNNQCFGGRPLCGQLATDARTPLAALTMARALGILFGRGAMQMRRRFSLRSVINTMVLVRAGDLDIRVHPHAVFIARLDVALLDHFNDDLLFDDFFDFLRNTKHRALVD